jgi:tetratricopeptide (TPR) repeat protein
MKSTQDAKQRSFRNSNIYAESVERLGRAIEFDAQNASAHAALAATYLEAGERAAAIHQYRLAIGISPHGPSARGWKTQLKGALEVEARLARGQSADGFADFKVCDGCGADVAAASKSCPRCGTRLEMGFLEWSLQKRNLQSIAREALPMIAVVLLALAILSHFSIEIKACVAMAGVIVGGIYFLRAIGGGN